MEGKGSTCSGPEVHIGFHHWADQQPNKGLREIMSRVLAGEVGVEGAWT